MALSATSFLMFQGKAAEALRLYTETFTNASVERLELRGEGDGGAPGTVQQAWLRIADQKFRVFDSPTPHAFTFTPSFSIFVECEDEAELERVTAQLSDGGAVLMPLDDYGFSRRFAWINDRYGVSWQLNLT